MKTVAVVTENSQTNRLKILMQEKNMTHAADVRVDIPGVKVIEGKFPAGTTALQKIFGKVQKTGTVYFCNVPGLNIRKVLQSGDGRRIPDQAVVQGLKVRKSGFYNLVNARIFSNGMINVVVDSKTEVVPATTR
jgi:hypothetical protein